MLVCCFDVYSKKPDIAEKDRATHLDIQFCCFAKLHTGYFSFFSDQHLDQPLHLRLHESRFPTSISCPSSPEKS